MNELLQKNGAEWRRLLLYWTTAAIWGAIAVLFLAYFVILNSTPFIFYSILAFFALIPIIIVYRASLKYIIYLSIITIAAGSVAYTNILGKIFPEYIIGILIIELVQTRQRWLDGTGWSMLTIAMFLPAILYSAGVQSSQTLSTNIAIIGYYLLIVGTIGMILQTSRYLGKVGSKAAKGAAPALKYLAGAAIIGGIVILIMPIWPAHYVESANLPYINLTIANYSGPGNYSIQMNLTKYSKYLNTNVTNIRLSYGGASYAHSAIKSYISSLTVFYSNEIILFSYINASKKTRLPLRLYILPENQTYGSNLLELNGTGKLNSTVNYKAVKAMVGNFTGSGFTDIKISYTVGENATYTSIQNISMIPYLQTEPFCAATAYANIRLDYHSSLPINAFMFNRQSELQAAMLNLSNSYANYTDTFTRYADSEMLHASSGGFSTTLNDTCAEIAFVSQRNASISINETETYKKQVETAREAMTYNDSRIIKQEWFLPSGVSYLNSIYASMTNKSAQSS